MVTEADFELTPDAIAGRRLLDARLARLSKEEFSAFWEAANRCYASAKLATEAPGGPDFDDPETT